VAGGWLLFTLAGFRRSARPVAVVVVATLLAPLYLFELYRNLMHPDHSKAAHVLELRRAGVRAYPSVFPSGLVELWQRLGVAGGIEVGGRRLLPLAGIPDVPTVYCEREDGSMVVYRSDALGFRNPSGSRSEPDLVLALLGDSFVQGFCVDEPYTFRARMEDLGATRSFGMNGTSPLAQAAIYTEYVRPLRPRRLVWFFFEGNDIDDFLREREEPMLRAYLEPHHTQELLAVHSELARATREFLDAQLSAPDGVAVTDDEETFAERAKGFLLLRRTRSALLGARRAHAGAVQVVSDPDSVPSEVWGELRELWRNVLEQQRAAGGEVTFVYLPADSRFVIDPTPFRELERRVTAIWDELGADHVSLSGLVAALPDPLRIYSRNHLDAEGYELGADAIEAHLRSVMARSAPGRSEPAVKSAGST
jgi:hypothetical protein